MARSPRLNSKTHPYHVTARGNNRSDFPLPIEESWKVFNDSCLALTWFFEVQVHAFVLMPNHFHLIMTSPVWPLEEVMEFFMRETAREINRRSGRRGHLFGGPYNAPLILTPQYFTNAMKYVYRNPVAIRIARTVEEYPYSTLGGRAGLTPLQIPIGFSVFSDRTCCIESDPLNHLVWLNESFDRKQLLALGQALKRNGTLDLKKDPVTRRVTPFSDPSQAVLDADALRKSTA